MKHDILHQFAKVEYLNKISAILTSTILQSYLQGFWH